jgi:futalosine hydrolase
MSYLITAATDFELQAFVRAGGVCAGDLQLVTGIGPTATALSLCSRLQQCGPGVRGVINFGVAGAYPDNGTGNTADMLDICLARREVLGDLGICLEDGFERFTAPDLQARGVFSLDESLRTVAHGFLARAGVACKTGTFITVNCASGTARRGRLLAREFQGLCENMEGAAVALVCERFGLPCVEVRCISNLVVDRNTADWKLREACCLAGRAAAVIAGGLSGMNVESTNM